MAPFGVSEAAVRQSVSRMSRQGWLVARREGNRAFYAVTERGRRRIEELSPRIYGPVIEWDGRWRMLTYSVSEAQRERRDRLRKELTVLGWAPLSSSTWISPAEGLGAAREAAEAIGALGAVDLFDASYAGPLSDRALLEKCWDVGAIAAAVYRVHRALRAAAGSRAVGRSAERRSRVRGASLARSRLPEVRLHRSGAAKRAASSALAGDDRRRTISRVLRGGRCQVDALFVGSRSEGRACRTERAMPKRVLILLAPLRSL